MSLTKQLARRLRNTLDEHGIPYRYHSSKFSCYINIPAPDRVITIRVSNHYPRNERPADWFIYTVDDVDDFVNGLQSAARNADDQPVRVDVHV